MEVLFHLGANQDPKPCVLEISCTCLSLVPLENLIWQRSVKVNQFTVPFCRAEVQRVLIQNSEAQTFCAGSDQIIFQGTTRQPLLLLMGCDVRSTLVTRAAEGRQGGCPFPVVCRPFCAPSSVPLLMLKWEKCTESLHIPVWHRGRGCELGTGADLGGLTRIFRCYLGKEGAEYCIKDSLSSQFSSVQECKGHAEECSVLLPPALGVSAWDRVRKLLSPKPRQGNPFAGFLAIMGHPGCRTQHV